MSDSRQILPLDALSPQRQGTIVSINCRGPVRRRLMDMGLTPGTRVTVEGAAPFGDPMVVWARGCRLALRRLEAAQISVQPCPSQVPQHIGQWSNRGPGMGRHGHRWGQRGPGRGRGWRKGRRDS